MTAAALFLRAGGSLPPGPASWPRRDVFLLGALGVVLLVAGVVLMILVRRLRARGDETLEGQ